MQFIHQTIKPFDKLLKRQTLRQEEIYRPMNFIVEQPVDEGLLLYHVMTKAMVLLSPKEAKTYRRKPSDLPELVEQWFLVPQSHDDRLLCKQFAGVAMMLERHTDAITHYTIMTTTDCNARCFYCYELGRPRVPMSQEIAKHTANYIIKHSKGEKVRLTWFGGEPLFNKSVITLICQLLRDAGIDYSSFMVSNGYLINENVIREAKDLWHLNDVQITLDGTERIYNRSKAYIYKDVNAYRHVITNIHRLQDAGIIVRIRLNVDIHNADNLMELIEELHHEFTQPKGISVYTHILFEYSKGSQAMGNSENRTVVFQKMTQMREKMKDYGLLEPLKHGTVKTNSCQADNDNCIVITPSGHIGKCEHFTEDHLIGHIDLDEYDQKAIAQFKERVEFENCANCAAYPTCIVLKQCPDKKDCYPEVQGEKLEKIHRWMMNAYKEYKQTTNEIQN